MLCSQMSTDQLLGLRNHALSLFLDTHTTNQQLENLAILLGMVEKELSVRRRMNAVTDLPASPTEDRFERSARSFRGHID